MCSNFKNDIRASYVVGCDLNLLGIYMHITTGCLWK